LPCRRRGRPHGQDRSGPARGLTALVCPGKLEATIIDQLTLVTELLPRSLELSSLSLDRRERDLIPIKRWRRLGNLDFLAQPFQQGLLPPNVVSQLPLAASERAHKAPEDASLEAYRPCFFPPEPQIRKTVFPSKGDNHRGFHIDGEGAHLISVREQSFFAA